MQSMITIQIKYQIKKPLPIVILKTFSGSGNNPCPNWVQNGYVTAATPIVIRAPFHHFHPDLAFSGRLTICPLTYLKNGISVTKWKIGNIDTIADNVANKTKHSLTINT